MYNFILTQFRLGKIDAAAVHTFASKGYITKRQADDIIATKEEGE